MSISRALVALLLLLLITVVGIVLYLQFGDMNRHRQSIQNLVSESVGREFHIIGDLKVKLFASTTLTADGLTLANASWGNQPLMLEVGELSVALNPWSLLTGPLEIERFTLDGIKVLEEHNREGQSNWGFWQLNSRRLQNIQHLQSSHCPTPFCKRTFPEISIVLCSDKMAPKIEQVVNGSMST